MYIIMLTISLKNITPNNKHFITGEKGTQFVIVSLN